MPERFSSDDIFTLIQRIGLILMSRDVRAFSLAVFLGGDVSYAFNNKTSTSLRLGRGPISTLIVTQKTSKKWENCYLQKGLSVLFFAQFEINVLFFYVIVMSCFCCFTTRYLFTEVSLGSESMRPPSLWTDSKVGWVVAIRGKMEVEKIDSERRPQKKDTSRENENSGHIVRD